MRNISFINIVFISIFFISSCSLGPVIVNLSNGNGTLTAPTETTSTKTTDVSPNTPVAVNGGNAESNQQKTNQTETKK